MKQTRDANNIIFSSIHNERQHHTPEPPKKPVCSATWSIHNELQHHTPEPPKKPVRATWSKHVAPNANITPQNPPKNLLIVPHEANTWHQQHHLL